MTPTTILTALLAEHGIRLDVDPGRTWPAGVRAKAYTDGTVRAFDCEPESWSSILHEAAELLARQDARPSTWGAGRVWDQQDIAECQAELTTELAKRLYARLGHAAEYMQDQEDEIRYLRKTRDEACARLVSYEMSPNTYPADEGFVWAMSETPNAEPSTPTDDAEERKHCARLVEAWEPETEKERRALTDLLLRERKAARAEAAEQLEAERAKNALLSATARKLDTEALDLKRRIRAAVDGWRAAAASVHQPNSPSIYIDCAEELEAML